MSSCFVGSSMDEAKSTNKRIDEQLKIAKKMQKSQIKLLVLGAAESGKSTFIKQVNLKLLIFVSKKYFHFCFLKTVFDKI